jgi:hypothetical protein
MEKLIVNGKVYPVKELDFDYLADLDEAGVPLGKVTSMAGTRYFVAYCSGLDKKEVSKEITQHIVNGGKMTDITDVYAKALEDSGFFRALMEQAEDGQEEMEQTEAETTPKKKRAKVVSE